ncbi:MAG: prephenate dehydrogenase/arogenate dehydrogenase family protein [Bacteroidota bacterium]
MCKYGSHFNSEALLIDVGSTKSEIVAAFENLPNRFRAIGGHPMTGKGTAGVDGPSPHLFEDKIFILSPGEFTSSDTLDQSLQILEAIGAEAMTIDAGEHDKLVAAVSHLPYILQSILIHVPDRFDDERVWSVAAGGFRSMVAKAGDNPAMWKDILTTNRQDISLALSQMAQEINEFIALLRDGDDQHLSEYLLAARETHTLRVEGRLSRRSKTTL